jgi:NADH-quinone oxidoreductase subunit C
MSQSLEDLGAHIKSSMTSAIEGVSVAHGELTINARVEQINAVITFLRDDPRGRFSTLIDICGVDYPERANRFDVVYHLLSMHLNQRIRLKLETNEDTPSRASPPSIHVQIGLSAKRSTCTAFSSRTIRTCGVC